MKYSIYSELLHQSYGFVLRKSSYLSYSQAYRTEEESIPKEEIFPDLKSAIEFARTPEAPSLYTIYSIPPSSPYNGFSIYRVSLPHGWMYDTELFKYSENSNYGGGNYSGVKTSEASYRLKHILVQDLELVLIYDLGTLKISPTFNGFVSLGDLKDLGFENVEFLNK